MPENARIIEFDVTHAMRYSPIRKLEIVRIVEKLTEDETAIENNLVGPETFVGTYVEVLDPETNDVIYGYGYDRFVETHTHGRASIMNGTTPLRSMHIRLTPKVSSLRKHSAQYRCVISYGVA